MPDPYDRRSRGAGGIRFVAALLLSVGIVGCSSTSHRAKELPRIPGLPSVCRLHPGARCLRIDRDRFTVAVSPRLIRAATQVGIPLDRVIGDSLKRIAGLLPGPHTQIEVTPGRHVINGHTNPASGQVSIAVNAGQSPDRLKRNLTIWLPNTLAHEVDHSVRIEAGPGFGSTLRDQLISEGLSSAFDIQLQPTIRLPWIHALTARQERRMWMRARPLLNSRNLYHRWFLGGGAIPRWTGFQLGYHIVRDYLTRHPSATAASIVNRPAVSILAGSHYTP